MISEIVQAEEVFLCKSVKNVGITYGKDTCVVICVHGFHMQFGKIVNCAICHGVPYLLCQKMRTVGFERHFHAFSVVWTDDYAAYKISDLRDPNPLGFMTILIFIVQES